MGIVPHFNFGILKGQVYILGIVFYKHILVTVKISSLVSTYKVQESTYHSSFEGKLDQNAPMKYLCGAVVRTPNSLKTNCFYLETFVKVQIEGWAQDYSNSNIFLKPLFRGNLDPFVNNAYLGAIAHTSNGT